jgi:1-acyl-sn-glycerol-3-phosphate acyltransferase
VTDRSHLESLTKRRLLELARSCSVPGRSKMTKAQLVDALTEATVPVEPRHHRSLAVPGVGPADRVAAAARRAALDDRLGAFVDRHRTCRRLSLEGHPCGLPVVAGDETCGLHGGGDIYDTAVPLTGDLNVSSWPILLRHLMLADYDVDPIGLDPIVAEMAWTVLNRLYFDFFRVRVDGIEHVPMDGPALVVANHGGAALPYDGAMLGLTVMNEAPTPRRVRVIGTEVFNMLPWVSHLYRKVGAAYATRDDARLLLEHRHLVGVFPEGEHGFMKPVWEAYRVRQMGRGGFVDLAEEAKAPIVPVAIIGSEEVHPAFMVSKRLARIVKLFLPEQRVEEMAVFLNPVPLPVRWHLRFLEPVEPTGDADPLSTLERAEEVRRRIQVSLDAMLAQRSTVF